MNNLTYTLPSHIFSYINLPFTTCRHYFCLWICRCPPLLCTTGLFTCSPNYDFVHFYFYNAMYEQKCNYWSQSWNSVTCTATGNFPLIYNCWSRNLLRFWPCALCRPPWFALTRHLIRCRLSRRISSCCRTRISWADIIEQAEYKISNTLWNIWYEKILLGQVRRLWFQTSDHIWQPRGKVSATLLICVAVSKESVANIFMCIIVSM